MCIAPMHSYVTNVFVYNLYIAIFSRVYSYVLVCHSYVIRMYSYVTRIYSYVIRMYSYVTHMYSCGVLVKIPKKVPKVGER